MITQHDSSVAARIARLADALTGRDWRLALAESCTGGLIAAACTDRPGSSRWFERAFISYSNEAKQEMLLVAPSLLARHGAVSEITVREMVTGALAHSRADIAAAVSGIAGPDGGSDDKPVGTVWIAWQVMGAVADTQRFCFEGDRSAIRRAALLATVDGLIDRAAPATMLA